MLGAQFCVRTVTGFSTVTDQDNACRLIPSYSWYHQLSFRLNLRNRNCCRHRSKSVIVLCKSSRGRSPDHSEEDHDHDYIEAFVLISETIRHYRMRMQGFEEEMKWKSSSHLLPFSVQAKDPRADVSSIGLGFLRRFQSPTIFLKISCGGDFLLPIIVGEFAVEKLIDSSQEYESVDFPNQFQLVRNLVEKLGYKVKMVRITERVFNTYFARIFFYRPGEKDVFSVDARPSDAINVARRCRVPILVNKQIVLTDAVKIVYGMGRMREAKSIYNVSLDSAADGPDLLSQELDLMRNMNLAAKEERYTDAAMWRDKLLKLLESRQEF